VLVHGCCKLLEKQPVVLVFNLPYSSCTGSGCKRLEGCGVVVGCSMIEGDGGPINPYAVHQLRYHTLLAKLEAEGPDPKKGGALVAFLQRKHAASLKMMSVGPPEHHSNGFTHYRQVFVCFFPGFPFFPFFWGVGELEMWGVAGVVRI
jgi:hypothetical protein